LLYIPVGAWFTQPHAVPDECKPDRPLERTLRLV
jgi:hypothetical protein